MNETRMAGMRNPFLFAAVLFTAGALLAAGLWPFPFFTPNHAQYDPATGCLSCDRVSSAYLPMTFDGGSRGGSPPVTVELRLAFKPPARYGYLARILTLYDVTTGTEALTIGQWGRSLVVRVRKASNENRLPMVAEQGIDSFFAGKDSTLIAIRIDRTVVSVAGAGRVMDFNNPILPDSAIMTFGNSTQGDCPWRGTVCIGMAGFAGALSDSSAAMHSSAPVLVMPRYFRPVVKTALKPVWDDRYLTMWYARDVILNFLGFIPYGFLLVMLLRQKGGRGRRAACVIGTGIGLCTSLTIELLQVFMPYRSSQMSDVIFNTLGTVCGAVLFVIWGNRPKTRPDL